MIWTVFVAENFPWCYWCAFTDRAYAQFGEWAWVGRVYP